MVLQNVKMFSDIKEVEESESGVRIRNGKWERSFATVLKKSPLMGLGA